MNEYVAEKGRLQREDVMDIIKGMPSSNVVNYIFQNKTSGEFQNKNQDWGIREHSNSNGALYADLDNDGDLDLVDQQYQSARIYLPEMNHKNWITIISSSYNLTGKQATPRAWVPGLGFFIAGKRKPLSKILQEDIFPTFRSRCILDWVTPSKADSLIITWSSGKVQKLYDIKANQLLKLAEKDAVDKSSG